MQTIEKKIVNSVEISLEVLNNERGGNLGICSELHEVQRLIGKYRGLMGGRSTDVCSERFYEVK